MNYNFDSQGQMGLLKHDDRNYCGVMVKWNKLWCNGDVEQVVV